MVCELEMALLMTASGSLAHKNILPEICHDERVEYVNCRKNTCLVIDSHYKTCFIKDRSGSRKILDLGAKPP